MARITYSAETLTELADYLDGQARERRESAKHAVRKALQRELVAEARGIEFAAGIVRETTLVPA